MATRAPCAIDEWYHCFNRGVDKRVVFLDEKDYERFLMLLYASNGTNPIWISSNISPELEDLLEDGSIERGEPLIEIGAYALMPNHPHIVLKQIRENGIARFMQKVFTGYTMYFNLKYSRTGALFAGTYKAKHISNDTYLKQVISYVLMNPAELFESEWKKGIANIDTLETKLLGYRYSSLPDFFGITRVENKIVTDLVGYYDSVPTLSEMLSEAQQYHQDANIEV